jgi:EGF-like domain
LNLTIFPVCVVSTQVNPCTRNPCQNGGTCLNAGTSYVCRCASAWVGSNCTIGLSVLLYLRRWLSCTFNTFYITAALTYCSCKAKAPSRWKTLNFNPVQNLRASNYQHQNLLISVCSLHEHVFKIDNDHFTLFSPELYEKANPNSSFPSLIFPTLFMITCRAKTP